MAGIALEWRDRLVIHQPKGNSSQIAPSFTVRSALGTLWRSIKALSDACRDWWSRTDVVRILTAAGAELCLRGTGTRPSRRNQPSPSLEVIPRWSRSCAPVLHIDPNDKKPAFRNRIFMQGGASEADISTA